jgi:NAD+ synthase (glutamine-hydrolysing)
MSSKKIEKLRLYCAQINCIVGDFKGNFEKIAFHVKDAKTSDVDIIAFPELSVTGYPPEDLVLKPAFIEENLKYLEKIKNLSENIVIIAGFINRDHEIYNSAAILNDKNLVSIYNKQFLPNYSVFDEERYFQKGSYNNIYEINSIPVGVNICEDIYYSSGPTQVQAIIGGAKLIINISASPYHIGKIEERVKMLFTRAVDNRVNILYVNLVGGQDELVFDGNSFLVNEKGTILYRAKPFEEDYFIFDLYTEQVDSTRLQDSKYKNQRDDMKSEYKPLEIIRLNTRKASSGTAKSIEISKNKVINISLNNNIYINKNKYIDKYKELISCPEEEIFKALILGTRDYINKNNFKKVVLGLSGGIDSALTAVIASFAIGCKNVIGIIMPSVYSSKGSIEDSELLAKNIKIKTIIIPITLIYSSYLKNLKNLFKTQEINVTKENLQARIRGNILMGLSNEFGWLVLATGNKSEVSVGYCTLYGDMVGGYSPIKDIYKTMVYKICNFLNRKYKNIIPQSIIKKAPSAELKPNQKDQDKLPPYEILDRILKAYIEDEKDYEDIVKIGINQKIIKDVINMIDFNEYKRRQGAPGIKITERAFGRDRRYPITNRFKLK